MKPHDLPTGRQRQNKAEAASRAAFGGGNLDAVEMPTSVIASGRLESGIPIMELFHEVGLANSRSEARRLVQQGGAYINEEKCDAIDAVIHIGLLEENALLLRAGKKRYHRIIIEEN